MNQICYKWTSFKTEKKTFFFFMWTNWASVSQKRKKQKDENGVTFKYSLTSDHQMQFDSFY